MTKEIVRELVNGEWVTTVADSSGGGGSQAVKIETVDLVLADFTYDVPDGYLLSPTIYTVQPGEHVLFVLGRITETFDDSGVPAFGVTDELFSIGFLGPNAPVGITDVPVPSGGLVTLNGATIGSSQPLPQTSVFTPDSSAVPLIVAASAAGDGNTGALTIWLYIGTP